MSTFDRDQDDDFLDAEDLDGRPVCTPADRRREIKARLHAIDREKWAIAQADATAPTKEVRLRALNVEAEELRHELKTLDREEEELRPRRRW